MRLGFLCIENVDHLDSAHFKIVGNQRAMATPPNRFCAHDRGRPGLVCKIDKSFYAFAKFLGFDVIGVTAERGVSPGYITRVRSRFSAAAQLGKMFIMNSVFLE